MIDVRRDEGRMATWDAGGRDIIIVHGNGDGGKKVV